MKFIGRFFGSVAAFKEKFDVLNDLHDVIIDFKESRVVDMSAIEALNKITGRYLKVGKKTTTAFEPRLSKITKKCR